MGLDSAGVRFLCAARALGVDFTDTATIGRQNLFADAADLRVAFAALGVNADAEEFRRANPFADEFFKLLGARAVTSVDFSDYEGATRTHDMNQPLPADLRERFSAVHDGGTLEHVFNVPQGLKNCMEMVRVGGHFLQETVANNCMGHGFWQFSPELVYRVFSPANGYEVVAVLLHELEPGGAWYAARDPDQVRGRVQLCNRRATYMMTIARRVSAVEIFARPPQQSDYVAAWSGPAPAASNGSPIAALVRRTLPPRVLRAVLRSVRRARGALAPSFHPACYRRISEEALLAGKIT
jgi:hypothetical protein